MVTPVLVGVGLGEVGDGVVEGGRVAEVGRDRDPVTRAGMRAGQRPATQPGCAATLVLDDPDGPEAIALV